MTDEADNSTPATELIPAKIDIRLDESHTVAAQDNRLPMVAAAHESIAAMAVRADAIMKAKELADQFGDVSWRELLPPEFFAMTESPRVQVSVNSHADHSNTVNNNNKAIGNNKVSNANTQNNK